MQFSQSLQVSSRHTRALNQAMIFIGTPFITQWAHIIKKHSWVFAAIAPQKVVGGAKRAIAQLEIAQKYTKVLGRS